VVEERERRWSRKGAGGGAWRRCPWVSVNGDGGAHGSRLEFGVLGEFVADGLGEVG
jgi:hypothetical protein